MSLSISSIDSEDADSIGNGLGCDDDDFTEASSSSLSKTF
jgi:hypothetical protein